jgi:hypothetical protein
MVLSPGHPRAGKGRYVFEHILVMEEILGHRPENLELWTRPQPKGIRHSDAVAWAREIIARYGDASSATEGGPEAIQPDPSGS